MSQSNLRRGGKIAQAAFLIMLVVGILEVVIGSVAMTVALLADGIHSISTAIVFLIVWIGLRLSGRSPDGTFHFGYYRIEALGSLIAAFILATFGGFILFEAYRAWISKRIILHPEAAIIVAIFAAIITAIVSWRIQRASQEYSSTALRAGGFTGMIDVLSSVAVALGVIVSRYFEILHADSIAGILIAIAIFVGAYYIFKESSIVLVDACKCGDVITAIADVAKNVKGIKEVHNIRMRKLGRYMIGDMHIIVDSAISVREADKIATEVEKKIKEEFEKVIDINVRIESEEMNSHN